MAPPLPGAPKLIACDPASGRRLKTIDFSHGSAIRHNTYLNDVRFALSDDGSGHALITDSGAGGIIVVDLESGQAWRKLDGHESVMAENGLELKVEDQPLKRRPAGGAEEPMKVHSDGIALSPDGSTLYYTPLTSRSVYAVPVASLVDQNLPAERVAQSVRKIAQKPSANDGIICDARGRIYTTDFEDQSIRVIIPMAAEPAGGGAQVAAGRTDDSPRILVQDERLLWPDTLSIGPDGDLYIAVNQLHRQPGFHKGQDLRVPPYVIFRYPIGQ
jgi:sugar lactone lactonase YvrE